MINVAGLCLNPDLMRNENIFLSGNDGIVFS